MKNNNLKKIYENKIINYLTTNISINGKAFLNGNHDVIDSKPIQKDGIHMSKIKDMK